MKLLLNASYIISRTDKKRQKLLLFLYMFHYYYYYYYYYYCNVEYYFYKLHSIYFRSNIQSVRT
jgi:hypothetical protein